MAEGTYHGAFLVACAFAAAGLALTFVSPIPADMYYKNFAF